MNVLESDYQQTTGSLRADLAKAQAENERLREEREEFVWALCEISECTDSEEMKKIAQKALENVNKG